MSSDGRADLHLHTRFSDGSYEPAELVRLAKDLRFSTIAITDHDTVAAVAAAEEEGRKLGVRVIPGVEVSTLYQDQHETHIVGLFFDPRHAGLVAALERSVVQRVRRIERILGMLQNMGVEITLEHLVEHAPGEVLGRMQLAEALVRTHQAGSFGEAFGRYLGVGRPAYVPSITGSIEECCRMIREAGGVAVLAHPGEQVDEQKVAWAVNAGCRALEAYYPLYSRSVTDVYVKLAAKLGIGVSGGSDCHGRRKSRAYLGTVSVPAECVEDLERRRG